MEGVVAIFAMMMLLFIVSVFVVAAVYLGMAIYLGLRLIWRMLRRKAPCSG